VRYRYLLAIFTGDIYWRYLLAIFTGDIYWRYFYFAQARWLHCDPCFNIQLIVKFYKHKSFFELVLQDEKTFHRPNYLNFKDSV
jgi:hypothetical protein